MTNSLRAVGISQHVANAFSPPLTVGVLGLQGSFAEHASHLRSAGATVKVCREPGELLGCHALVVPGGESTVMTVHMQRCGWRQALLDWFKQGGCYWGTCAGAILAGQQGPDAFGVVPLGLMDVQVERNAYGRQAASFVAPVRYAFTDRAQGCLDGVFIRAPRFDTRELPAGVDVVAWCEDATGTYPVGLMQGRCLLTTFHPELLDTSGWYQSFLAWVVDCLADGPERAATVARMEAQHA